MKKIKMAAPLFIVRSEYERDLGSVLKKMAQLGFDGVEFVGFTTYSAEDVKRMADEAGIEILSNHAPYRDLMADPEGVMDYHKTVGCTFVTVGDDMPVTDFETVSKNLDMLAKLAADRGMRLLYHNHDQELIEKTDGKDNLAYIMDNTKPETMALEPDLGWIEIGGSDPSWYLKQYQDRCPVIHLKDYYSEDNSLLGRVREFSPHRGVAERGHFEFRPTGYGVVNLPKLMPLCLKCDPEWFVIDHDLAYDRDSYEDLKLGLEYTRKLLEIQAKVGEND